MAAESTHKLVDVFGTSRGIPATYLERPGVDDRFLNDLAQDKHIVIHGASRQGKTCLRKYHMKEDDYVVIQCTGDSSKASLYQTLLQHAGIQCLVSDNTTLTGSKKLQAFVNAAGAAPTKTEGLEIDPEDVNDIIRMLKAVGFHKHVVVEDFHYLDEEIQQSLAFDLKVFHESSEFLFIVIGGWLDADKLTLYNGDLSGRVATINTDHWEPDQLRTVIDTGAALLNISVPERVRDLIVGSCHGNVGLLQEVCYRLCEQHKIWQTQTGRIEVGSEGDVEETLRAAADEQTARYRNFLARFAEGLDETPLKMYKWIGYAVIHATADELRRGLRPNAIYHRIRPNHPEGDSIQHENIIEALERVGKVQFQHKLQPPIFDFSNGELAVVDAAFLVFTENHSKKELLEYLGFEL